MTKFVANECYFASIEMFSFIITKKFNSRMSFDVVDFSTNIIQKRILKRKIANRVTTQGKNSFHSIQDSIPYWNGMIPYWNGMEDFPFPKLVQGMEELFSLFPTPFQANSLLPTLGNFRRKKFKNRIFIGILEEITPIYPFFTLIYPFLPLYDVIHTLHSHASFTRFIHTLHSHASFTRS